MQLLVYCRTLQYIAYQEQSSFYCRDKKSKDAIKMSF